jgi:SOS-response transcriptional repressor LexA
MVSMEIKNPVGMNLRKARKKVGLSLQQVADKFGISREAVSQWESQTRWSLPSTEKLPILAELYKTSIESLFTGLSEEPSNVEPASPPAYKVPIISWVRAGHFDTLLDQRNVEEVTEWIYLDKQPGPRGFALRVRGPSMEPRFQDGDFIVVDPDVPWEEGNFVVLGNGNDEATFKQIVQVDNEWWARPLNPQFAAKKMDPTCRVIGRVIWHQKPGMPV